MFYKYIVYITTNANKSTLYIGITNNIQRRLSQHFSDSLGCKHSFAGRYNCYYLVYYEAFEQVAEAILREKQIKKWNRLKKESLIASINPDWHFLNNEIF
jgi:putative endonuclease